MQKKRNRQRVNRYRFTINNPFITDDVKVLCLDSLTDEQKELFEKSRSRNDFAHLRDLPYFDFAVCEYSQKEYGEVFSKVVAERIFFKDYAAAQEYFKKIDFIDYVCFQYEQGALGTKHLQGFMHFNRQMDFSVVREIYYACFRQFFNCVFRPPFYIFFISIIRYSAVYRDFIIFIF